MKKIGVVLATYNGEKYIEEQLNSIIHQSFKPDIIIVSDGGSTDNTVSMCDKVLKCSGVSYVILESKERLQVTENFQRGLENCIADYIFFSDQDDIWLTDKIEQTMRGFIDDTVMMVFTDAMVVEDKSMFKNGNSLWSTIGFHPNAISELFEQYNKAFLETLLKHNVVTGMCLAISSRLKPFLFPFPKCALHDAWIALSAIHHGSVVAVNKQCVLYRQHQNNVVGTKFNIMQLNGKRKRYSNNVVNRLNFVIDVYRRSEPYDDFIAKEMIQNYIDFLKHRYKFLQSKNSILFPLRNLKYYKRFEYNYREIVFKDYLTRLSRC